jgi:hypothetical protein
MRQYRLLIGGRCQRVIPLLRPASSRAFAAAPNAAANDEVTTPAVAQESPGLPGRRHSARTEGRMGCAAPLGMSLETLAGRDNIPSPRVPPWQPDNRWPTGHGEPRDGPPTSRHGT